MLPRTGEIGAFKIVSDRGIAQGQRRIEAVTSLGAVELLSQDERVLASSRARPRRRGSFWPARWQEREERVKALEREVASLKLKLASGDTGTDGSAHRVEVGGVPVVTRVVEGLSIPELRNLSDTLRSKLKQRRGGGGNRGRREDLGHHRRDAGPDTPAARPPRSPRRVGKSLSGSGGGKPDLAQAGGKNADLLPAGLKAAAEAVRDLLAEPVAPLAS